MAIALALGAALGWGAADFLARFAAQGAGSYRTLFYMQFYGLVALALYCLLDPVQRHLLTHAGPGTLALTAGVTLLETAAALALYRSFEVGTLSIVSPVAASFAALTVLLSLLSGESLSGIRALGIVLTLVGVVLVAAEPSHARDEVLRPRGAFGLPAGVAWALTASVLFGVTFWALGFTVEPRVGSVVPVLAGRALTPPALLLLMRPLRQSLAPPRSRTVWWYLTGVGMLDTAAFLAATAALGHGHVAIVGVLISLFSAVTVLLAWIFLREELARSQWLGVGVVFVGVSLVNL